MQTKTTKKRTPPLTVGARSYNRTRRTHELIERAARAAKKPIVGQAILVAERVRESAAWEMTRAALERHLERVARRAPDGARASLFEIRDAVRATPPHRAPVVIATIEGRVILQWLEEHPS